MEVQPVNTMEAQPVNTMDAQLYQDVLKGKCKSLKERLIEDLGILEGKTPQGNTALHVAASRGHHEMVELLINRKPCILLIKNFKGETPLHKAAAAGHLKAVKVFLERNPQLPCNCGAHKKDDIEACDSTLEWDAKSFWTGVNNDNETALHYAARGGDVRVVKTLLTEVHGIEKTVNEAGESALYTACDHGRIEVATCLLNENFSVDDTRKDKRTCLHVAISTQQEDLAKRLLDKRRGLAEKADALGNMPLHLAALHGCLDVVQDLLSKAPETNFRSNNEKMYPIHIAAQMGCEKTIKLLIETAPQCIELLGKQKKNALHFAMEKGENWQVMKYLVQNALDVALLINEPDEMGNTALQMALKFVNVEVVELMLQTSRWIMNPVIRRICGHIFKELAERRNMGRNPQGAEAVSKNEINSSDNGEVIGNSKGNDCKSDTAVSITTSGKGARIENREGDDMKNDSAQTLSIIATLLATVTFAALFTIPGGVSSEEGVPVRMHTAALRVFIIADTLAMCFSMLALMVLLDVHYVYLQIVELTNALFGFVPTGNSSRKILQKRGFFIGRELVSLAFGATMVSYATGLYVLVAPRCLWLAVFACVMVSAIILIRVFLVLRSLSKFLRTPILIIFDLMNLTFFPQDV